MIEKILICFLSVICIILAVSIQKPTTVLAAEHESWDGHYKRTYQKDGFSYYITKEKDTAKKINGEAWIGAAPGVKLTGSLTIPKTVKEKDGDKVGYHIVGICSHGFYMQEKITRINIDANMKEIGENAFSRCEKLKKINLPSSLRYIGSSAFLGTALQEIKVPDKVKVIKDSTFFGCSSLKKVTMKNSVTRIENSAFDSCVKLKTVILSKKLKSLGKHAFENCRALKSITLPGSLESIEESCFELCMSLKSLTLPAGITKIRDALCCECTSLEKVVLGKGVTDIGASAFLNCTALTDIKLPSKLKNINDNAFGSSGLINIDFPASLRTIGKAAFLNCDKLHEAIIPEGVTQIGESAFAECEVLHRVDIPSTVKLISKSAFWMNPALSELRLAEGVKEIGEDAFHYTNLSEIDFPKSATIIYATSFMETPFMTNMLNQIQDDQDLFDYYIVNGNLLLANEYEYKGENMGYVEKKIHHIPGNVKRILCDIGNSQTEEITIPSGVEYMVSVSGTFDEIKLPSALKHIDRIGSPNIKSLELPEGLENLPEIYCSSLTSITIPPKAKITLNKPFYGCTNLKKIVIKGKVTSLPSGLLAGTQVTSFTIPDTVESLSNINEGTELDSVVIPVGVKTIYWNGDSNLRNLEIKEGYDEYYSVDFSFCTNLVNVKLPNSMTRIPSSMFTGCTSLKEIILPKNLKVIEPQAFSDTEITDVTIPKGCESIETGAFDSGTTLRIHKDSRLLDRADEYLNYGYKIVKYK